ncbi:cytochrome c maturation protein CcmE [Marinihelvus fidelis]|uniref:Cytochrome c-type biogenesis protein CcmE n=1 Tax=Marinihelvus fidelis TaxID=2613842 RepID=A0A5N0T7T8_9GAMM|nr:cytochrome c maturation protein CcmE [Marinihelvus fidelis]KAA9130564.1 cytochrome c maturation protein CcmE [Marinihelvus fidelis]
MHPVRRRRLFGILIILVGVGVAAALLTWSLRQNMLYFISPKDVQAQSLPPDRAFRLGGLVELGSVRRADDGLQVEFVVTDGVASVPVRFDGILPDLFREGQGIIARGTLGADGVFTAAEVLAKHDENYMPPEVAEALREAGHPMGGQPVEDNGEG